MVTFVDSRLPGIKSTVGLTGRSPAVQNPLLPLPSIPSQSWLRLIVYDGSNGMERLAFWQVES